MKRTSLIPFTYSSMLSTSMLCTAMFLISIPRISEAKPENAATTVKVKGTKGKQSAKPGAKPNTEKPATPGSPQPTPPATAQNKSSGSSTISLGSSKNRNEPVYVTSDKLDLDSEKRVFVYTGNVKVVQADVTIIAQEMVGTYGQDNKIETITARKDVVVTKDPDLRATSQAGVYNARTGIATLTENPHLFQAGNDLAADKITIDLNTNKSSAEGQVRMKVIKAPDGDQVAK